MRSLARWSVCLLALACGQGSTPQDLDADLATIGRLIADARARGFALDMSMGGPDADDADFRESA